MVDQIHDTPPRPRPTPRPSKELGIACSRCGGKWGKCERSCNYVSAKVDEDCAWFILGLAVGMVVTSVFFNLL